MDVVKEGRCDGGSVTHLSQAAELRREALLFGASQFQQLIFTAVAPPW